MNQVPAFEPKGQPVRIHCKTHQEDLFHCLQLQQKAHGGGKRYFQMALSLVLAILMFLSWLKDRSYTMGLILGLLCVCLFLTLLFLPGIIMRHTAQMLAGNIKELDYQVFENGALVNDGMVTMALASEDTAVYEDNQMFLFETKAQRIYPIPKRMVQPIDLKILRQFLQEYPGFYRFADVNKG